MFIKTSETPFKSIQNLCLYVFKKNNIYKLLKTKNYAKELVGN